MYKIAVVDDEPLIRQSITHGIVESDLECQVCLEAGNIKEVVDYLEEHTIDIILLDINLPGVDGLTFANNLKSMDVDTKVIIISAYKEFNYAQKAVKIGVADYLTKPLRNEDLLLVLENTIDLIKKENEVKERQVQSEEEHQKIREFLEESKTVVEYNYLVELLLNQIDEQDMEQYLKVLPKDTQYCAIIILRNLIRNVNSSEKIGILNYFRSFQGQNDYYVKPVIIGTDVVLSVFWKKLKKQVNNEALLKNICFAIQSHEKIKMEKQFFMGVSSIHEGVSGMHEAYCEALNIVNNQFFTTKLKNRISTKDQSDYGVSIIADLNLFYNVLAANANSKDYSKIEEAIEELVHKVTMYCGNDIGLAKSLLQDVCVTILRFYSEYNKQIQESELLLDAMERIRSIVNIHDVKKYLLELIQYCREDSGETQWSALVTQAVSYIKGNYNKDISLNSVAEYLGINASYLSRLLKKEVNKNFSEIVLEERMETAKMLLKDPRIRLNEIASMIGYKEYAYFYQVFKKSQEITPMEYRNGKKN